MAAVTAIDITSLLLVEGSTPTTPAATKQRLFIRSSDHQLALVNSSGAVTPIIPAGAMSLIGSHVLGSAATTLSVSGIAGTYNHLRAIVCGRGSEVTQDQFAYLKLNADGGTNYARELLQGGGATASAGATGSPSAPGTASFLGYIPCASATASVAGMLTIDIPLYAGTTFKKVATAVGGYAQDGSNGRTGTSNVLWASTAAITQVDVIITGGGNFVIGSSLYVYGIV